MKVDTCVPNVSKTCLTAWTERHFFRKFILLLLMFRGLKFDDEEPMKRWLGVSGSRSVMSLLMPVKDLPFKIDSTLHKKVWRQSLVKILSFMMAFKQHFTDLIRYSQILPIQGLTDGLKIQIHVISLWIRHLIILVWSNCHDFNPFSAPTKLVPLSGRITCTFPRVDMNLQRVNINASVDKSSANSLWTALVVRHVNSTPYLLAVPEFDLAFLFIVTWYGPKESIPMLRNSLSPILTLSFDTSPIRLFWGVTCSFLHFTQFLSIFFY